MRDSIREAAQAKMLNLSEPHKLLGRT
jgi:hypothetical protein